MPQSVYWEPVNLVHRRVVDAQLSRFPAILIFWWDCEALQSKQCTPYCSNEPLSDTIKSRLAVPRAYLH
jgi:hypothetical protein